MIGWHSAVILLLPYFGCRNNVAVRIVNAITWLIQLWAAYPLVAYHFLSRASIVHLACTVQFILGVANFVEWSLEQRTQFIFTLFDDDRSGFLSMVRYVERTATAGKWLRLIVLHLYKRDM